MHGVYFGWHMLATSALVYMLLIGSTSSAFGVFVVPVSAELGLSRANMNSALILLNVGNAIVAPFIGRMLDRVPMRLIMAGCAVMLGLAFVGLGLSRSLWLSAFLMSLPLAIGLQGAGTLTVTVLIARWFARQRGRAMALGTVGMSLGGVFVAPVIGWSIQSQGWRSTLIVTGIALTAILLLLSLVVRERPGATDVEPAGKSVPPQPVAPASIAAQKPQTAGALLRQRQFWTLALGVSIPFAVGQGLVVTLIPLALDSGLSIVLATSLISIAAGTAIAGKLALAVFADRVERLLLLAGLYGLMAAAHLLLLFDHGYGALVTVALLLGLATGMASPTFYALLADRFGVASFGTSRGLMAPIIAVVGAFAVRFSGEVFDRTGTYELLFYSFTGALLVAVLLMLLTRRLAPPRPEAVATAGV